MLPGNRSSQKSNGSLSIRLTVVMSSSLTVHTSALHRHEHIKIDLHINAYVALKEEFKNNIQMNIVYIYLWQCLACLGLLRISSYSCKMGMAMWPWNLSARWEG